MLYLIILCGDLCSNFAHCIVLKIFHYVKNSKILRCQNNFFEENDIFAFSEKMEFFTICLLLVNVLRDNALKN